MSLSSLSPSFGASCPLPAKQILLLPHAGDYILVAPFRGWAGSPGSQPRRGGGRAEGRRSVLPLLLVLKAGGAVSRLSGEHIPPRDPSTSGFAPTEVAPLAEGLKSTLDLCASPRPSARLSGQPWPGGKRPTRCPPSPGALASVSCGAPARVPEPGHPAPAPASALSSPGSGAPQSGNLCLRME